MYHFRIVMRTYDEIAKKILNKWQFTAYRLKLNLLLNMITIKLRKYKTEDYGDVKVFEETSEDKDFIENEKKVLESFLYADSSELRKEEYRGYSHTLNDRIIQKINKTAHKYTGLMKDKAIKLTLGGNDVLSFFNKIGISIEWKITEETEKLI